ncbi:hypothetical protein ACWDFL_33690 [Streptomyces bungoensis]
MRRAVSHHEECGAADPAFIVTQVGDEPWDKAGVRSTLQNTASLGVFWPFVGFGRGKLAFYKNLNASASATFTNVRFTTPAKTRAQYPANGLHGPCRRLRYLDATVTGGSTRTAPPR